jgi:hypothetical protein
MTNYIDDLERLERLHREGLLTEGEFQREKAALLAPPAKTRPRLWFIAAIVLVTLVVLAMFVAAIWREPGRSTAPGNVADISVADTLPANPTNEDYYNDAVRAAKKNYAGLPSKILDVLSREEGADELCRGGSDQAVIAKWCPIRDQLVTKLQSMGMCFGRPTDQSEADSDWHLCDGRDQPQSPPSNDQVP